MCKMMTISSLEKQDFHKAGNTMSSMCNKCIVDPCAN